MSELVQQCVDCERRMTGAMIDFVEAKFDRGLLIRDTVRNEKKYGAGLMEQLTGELKDAGYRVSESTLYREHAFAAMYGFDKTKLIAEIGRLTSKGLSVSYGLLCKKLEEHKNPDVVGGIENHATLTAKRIEDNAIELDEALEIHRDNGEVLAAVQMGFEVLQEGADWLLGDTTKPGITKEKPIELPHYLAWVRRQWPVDVLQPIGETEYNGPVEAHHLVLKSRGNAGMDLFTLPMTPVGHTMYHKLGHRVFEAEYGLDTRKLVLLHIQRFIQECR